MASRVVPGLACGAEGVAAGWASEGDGLDAVDAQTNAAPAVTSTASFLRCVMNDLLLDGSAEWPRTLFVDLRHRAVKPEAPDRLAASVSACKLL